MSEAPNPVRRRMIRLVDFHRNNCAKSTAFKWINEGRLRAYKLGGMTFVDQSFEEFVERQAAERVALNPEPALEPEPVPVKAGCPKGSRNAPGHRAGRSRSGAPVEPPLLTASPE